MTTQFRHRRIDVFHDDAFGNLDTERRRRVGGTYDVANDVDEIAMAKLDRGHVHRDPRRSETLLHPALVVGDGLAQSPTSQRRGATLSSDLTSVKSIAN